MEPPIIRPGPRLTRWRAHAIVFAAYTALTAIFTWPLAWHLTSQLPEGNDAWRYIWNLWWAKVSLADLHTNYFFTNYLYYPNGVNLYLDTPTFLLGVLGIPLQWAGLNLVGVYNVWTLISFVLAAQGTYLLVHYLSRDRWAAFVSGIVFAFCPFHFAQMMGHFNIASIQFIPFYVLALLKAVNWREDSSPHSWQSRMRAGLIAGGWLAVNSYVEWTYAAFLLLFTLWVALWRFSTAQSWRSRRQSLGHIAPTLIVWALLIAPVAVPMIREAVTTHYGQMPIGASQALGADLTDAVVPSAFHPLWKTLGLQMNDRWLVRPHPEKVVFAGYTVLVVAVIALWRFRRRSEVTFWGAAALVAWVLSLGPVLYVWGRHLFAGVRILLPYAALYYVPFFNIMRVPSRFTILVMLGLAVLAGYAMTLFTRRRGVIVAGLIAFEYLAVPSRTQPFAFIDEPIYHDIANESGTFAILDLPLRPEAIYEGYQTIHGKPIVGGYLARQPPDRFVEEMPVLRYLLPSTGIDDPASASAVRDGIAELRAANIRYVIVHERRFMAATKDQAILRAKVARVFAGETPRTVNAYDGTLTIYRLRP